MPAVSGLEAEYPGKVIARNVDAKQPETVQVVAGLGFRSHGLVIRNAAGDVLWKQPDHEVSVDDARVALQTLLEKEK